MEKSQILIVFLALRFAQHIVERWLTKLNRDYYENPDNRTEAARVLKINDTDMGKALAYSRDRFSYGQVSSWFDLAVLLVFIALGGLGLVERLADSATAMLGGGQIVTGLLFFGILALANGIISLPFELYYIFVLEQRHGFNRQNFKGFIGDKIKELLLGVVLGGALLALIFYIMASLGSYWWIAAWLVVFGFSLFTAWIYPTVLAPLFNKFSPLEDGELKNAIMALAAQVNFNASGISVMDASKRSSHGNAYFTGVFGEKKIVLFDNLTKSMSIKELVAVLAHELGHFKLHHIRWRLVVSFFMMGGIFYLLSLTMNLESFYRAFNMQAHTNYGALLVFSLWFGLLNFLLMPISSYFSRRHEFAADRFAIKEVGDSSHLAEALLKLRETSHLMPINHPLFSAVYLSHPPLLERLRAMGYFD